MGQGLEGLNVLELGGNVAAPLAAKLMADLGATVVKVEPPGGDPARRRGPFRDGRPDPEASGLFLALNANKRSVVLDLEGDAGQAELERLVARTDLLVHNLPLERMRAQRIDYARFAALNPRLVMLTLTPFGLTGPYADYAATDLTVMCAGGWSYICPGPGTPPERPPIKPFGQHAWVQAAVHGAMAAMGAVFGARANGVGDHVEVSAQEVEVSHLGRTLVNYTYAERVETRTGPRLLGPMGFFRCRDGEVMMIVIEEDQWTRLVELMGNPAWADDPRFADRLVRGQHNDLLEEHINAWMADKGAEELFALLQERKLCCAPILTYDQVVRQPQLLARDFIQSQVHPVAGELVMPGAPYKLQRPWWALRTPAPRLGEANGERDGLFAASNGGQPAGASSDPARPLAGVRVVDFSWVWAGPYCAMQLAHLGAEVIKVESARRPEYARRLDIYPPGMEKGLNRSGYYNDLNQGKQSLTLNLGSPEGLALAKRLVASSDVVLSNFATGVMERLGLGADELHKLNPDLVIGAISGFGQTGPVKHYTAYGPALVPLSGITASVGYGDGKAQEVGIAYGDPNAGAHMAFILLASLVARQRHGGGQFIDLSLWEATATTGFEGWLNHALGGKPYPPDGNHDPVHAPYNLYRCAGEDRWVSICAETEAQWRALCAAMGQPALADDPRFADAAARKAHEAELDALIAAWVLPQERWELTRALQAAGVPAFPSLDARDLAEDANLNARDYFTRLEHGEVGVRTHQGPPWRFTRRPNGACGPSPLLGAHTDRVLTGLLGVSAAEVERLRAAGILE